MAHKSNKGYASVRIQEGTVEKLKKLRDTLEERENAERARGGYPARRRPLSINDVLEKLLYDRACEQARHKAYNQRRKG